MNPSKIKNFILSNRFILILILIVATVLRFYNLFNIPFTHDEFSALFRTYFNSFSDLIDYGVKVDGHPAGVQVFLFYWTKTFGESEWVVKLPFLLCGVASVYLIYKIGTFWFNETVGLLSSAYLATIQFAIMYSQIARPYGSGIFLSLMMVLFWSYFIRNQEKNTCRNLLLYSIFASLCTYNHYFSFLFAVIVAISGFFFIKQKFILKYFIANVLIVILYIPHFSIFIAQLKMGGVEGWLAKPLPEFFINYPSFIFHHSLFVVSVLTMIIIVPLFLKNKVKFDFAKSSLFLSWFLLPLLIGYFYSIYFNAVLQYSVLIFSFSFLFLFLFSHINLQNFRVNLIAVMLIIGVNVYSLVLERQHYKIFYTSAYRNILTDYRGYKDEFVNIAAYIDSNKKISSYYNKQIKNIPQYIEINDLGSRKAFVESVQKNAEVYDYIYLGCMSNNDPITVPVIMDHFPEIVYQNNYFAGTSYLFSKNKKTETEYFTILDFSNNANTKWTGIVPEFQFVDSTTSEAFYKIPDYSEWSPCFTVPLSELNYTKNDFVDVRVKFKSNQPIGSVFLVASLESKGKNVYYSSSEFSDFQVSNNKLEWNNAHLSLKLSDINLNYADVMLKVYIWNKSKSSFSIDDFSIKLRNGNPIVYSLAQ